MQIHTSYPQWIANYYLLLLLLVYHCTNSSWVHVSTVIYLEACCCSLCLHVALKAKTSISITSTTTKHQDGCKERRRRRGKRRDTILLAGPGTLLLIILYPIADSCREAVWGEIADVWFSILWRLQPAYYLEHFYLSIVWKQETSDACKRLSKHKLVLVIH